MCEDETQGWLKLVGVRFVWATWAAVALAGMHSEALAWSQRMSASWTLSENETQAKARELALEQLRQRAANAVGKAVESKTSLGADGSIKEEVVTIGASMVKITGVEERLSVGAGGKMVLNLSANVEVDESLLQKRIEQMRSDAQLRRQIELLKEQNVKLTRALEVSSGQGQQQALEDQRVLLGAIRQNQTNVDRAFSGTFLDAAKTMEEEWKEVYEYAMAKQKSEWENYKVTLRLKIVGVFTEPAPLTYLYVSSQQSEGYIVFNVCREDKGLPDSGLRKFDPLIYIPAHIRASSRFIHAHKTRINKPMTAIEEAALRMRDALGVGRIDFGLVLQESWVMLRNVPYCVGSKMNRMHFDEGDSRFDWWFFSNLGPRVVELGKYEEKVGGWKAGMHIRRGLLEGDNMFLPIRRMSEGISFRSFAAGVVGGPEVEVVVD